MSTTNYETYSLSGWLSLGFFFLVNTTTMMMTVMTVMTTTTAITAMTMPAIAPPPSPGVVVIKGVVGGFVVAEGVVGGVVVAKGVVGGVVVKSEGGGGRKEIGCILSKVYSRSPYIRDNLLNS